MTGLIGKIKHVSLYPVFSRLCHARSIETERSKELEVDGRSTAAYTAMS